MTGKAVPTLRAAARRPVFQEARLLLLHQAAFGPHEKRQMPVVFVIDPRLPRDVDTISRSYTFSKSKGN